MNKWVISFISLTVWRRRYYVNVRFFRRSFPTMNHYCYRRHTWSFWFKIPKTQDLQLRRWYLRIKCFVISITVPLRNEIFDTCDYHYRIFISLSEYFGISSWLLILESSLRLRNMMMSDFRRSGNQPAASHNYNYLINYSLI